MNQITIDDDFLFAHMKDAEDYLLAAIPSETELDHKFSRRFLQKMKALLKYEHRTPAMRAFVHYTKNAAAVFLIFISIAFTTAMSVEAYRVRFLNFVTIVWEELTSVFISSEDNADHNTLVPCAPSYVPEGYTVFEQFEDKYENIIIYQNDIGIEIYYSQVLLTQSEFIFDTQNADTDLVEIGNHTVYVLHNKGTVQVYWQDQMNSFSLISTTEETELIKMADSIINK